MKIGAFCVSINCSNLKMHIIYRTVQKLVAKLFILVSKYIFALKKQFND